MFKRDLPLTAAQKRVALRLMLALAAVLVLVSGAAVGRRAGRAAPSAPAPAAAEQPTGSVPDVLASGPG